MTMWAVPRSIAGVMTVIGGILLVLSWGLSLSLWTIIGLLLGGLGLYGGTLVLRSFYAKGGTMAAAAGIIAWGLYPTHPLSNLLILTVLLLAVGGVIGLVLELAAD